MPDSILAWVGPDREVSVGAFHRSWSEVAPPARPDSLTPDGANEFLQLLTGKEALGAAALRERWVWTARESAEYRALRDQMTLEVVLDSALRATRTEIARAGADSIDEQVIGIAARDSFVARLGPVFDDPLLERLAKAFDAVPKPSRDSGVYAQLRALGAMPVVTREDSERVVAHVVAARGAADDYRVKDLLASWKLLNPVARPRISTPSQVRDLVKNGLFERALRRDVDTRRIAERPEIVAALARKREYIAVTHYVGREVYEHIAMDSLTLVRAYAREPGIYDVPSRVRVTRLALATRDQAMAMAVRLRNDAEAESLVAQAARKHVDYGAEFSAGRDSVKYQRALRVGPGGVMGPDSTDRGWEVARVIAVIPQRSRSFAEARALVEHRWYGVEGERLMQALLERVRRQTPVRINARALAHLTAP